MTSRNLAGCLLIASAASVVGCSSRLQEIDPSTERIGETSLARFAGVRTGVVVVVDALSCGLSGRALDRFNGLHGNINVQPVLLTNWPETAERQAERMFSIPYRIVGYNAYASNVEAIFREIPRPFVAVFRESQLVSVLGNMNIDVTMESLLAHLGSLGVSVGG